VREILNHVGGVLPQFVAACFVIAVLPGPAMALFLHRTMRDGRAAGLAAVAGNEIGIIAWTLAAIAGITTLLQANRLLFDALHIAGAVVLVYLGVSAWRSATRSANGEFAPVSIGRLLPSGRSPFSPFRASLVSIAANPKAAAFAFSFFPQFLPTRGPVLPTGLVLTAVQLMVDSAVCVSIVLLATRIRPWLSRAAVRRRVERILGAVLVAVGIEMAAETH